MELQKIDLLDLKITSSNKLKPLDKHSSIHLNWINKVMSKLSFCFLFVVALRHVLIYSFYVRYLVRNIFSIRILKKTFLFFLQCCKTARTAFISRRSIVTLCSTSRAPRMQNREVKPSLQMNKNLGEDLAFSFLSDSLMLKVSGLFALYAPSSS